MRIGVITGRDGEGRVTFNLDIDRLVNNGGEFDHHLNNDCLFFFL